MVSLHNETVVKRTLTWLIQPYLDLGRIACCCMGDVIQFWSLGSETNLSRAAHSIEFAKDLIPSQAGTFEHHFFELAAG